MKPIIIRESNKDRIDTAIKKTEGRATARTIDYDTLASAISHLERSLGISKNAMIGCKVEIDCNAQNFPHAYKYMPESTIVSAEMTSSGWKITSICRGRTRSKNSMYCVSLTDMAKEAIIESKTRFS